jgi:hypothetical protein
MDYIKRLLKNLTGTLFIKFFPYQQAFNQDIILTKQELERLSDLAASCSDDVKHILNYIDKTDPDLLKEFDKKHLPKIFKERLGYELNLENPKTFNEKLQWLKIYYRYPEMTVMADKYLVRKFLEEKGYGKYLNKLHGVYQNVDEIIADWENLPASFILKPNHWSGDNIIIKEKSAFNLEELSKLSWLLKNNYYFFHRCGEWPYKDIKACIIAEKYLEDETGGLLDYKVFCFNGEAIYIQVDVDRFTNHTRCFYDRNWQKQPFTTHYPQYSGSIERPLCLNEMLSTAQQISKDYPHLRVDFYVLKDLLVFGEVTFTHGSGFERFITEEWDLKLGRLIDLADYN